MASNKKGGGGSRFEKGMNGRRSSKHKEGPVGELVVFRPEPSPTPLAFFPFMFAPPPRFTSLAGISISVSFSAEQRHKPTSCDPVMSVP